MVDHLQAAVAMRPTSILFDAAGTLFRVRGSVGLVYAAVAARHGGSVAPGEIEHRFRAAFRSMPPLAFPGIAPDQLPQHERAWWKTVVVTAFAGLHRGDLDTLFEDLFAQFARPDTWELFGDTEPALAALQARGLRLGVVSNFDGRLVTICHGLGIARRFDTIVMSGRVGYAKPDPGIFRVALDRLGVSAAEALHVGDSEDEDIKGARAAGLRAVLIQRDAPTSDDRPHLHDLRELLHLVDCNGGIDSRAWRWRR